MLSYTRRSKGEESHSGHKKQTVIRQKRRTCRLFDAHRFKFYNFPRSAVATIADNIPCRKPWHAGNNEYAYSHKKRYWPRSRCTRHAGVTFLLETSHAFTGHIHWEKTTHPNLEYSEGLFSMERNSVKPDAIGYC